MFDRFVFYQTSGTCLQGLQNIDESSCLEVFGGVYLTLSPTNSQILCIGCEYPVLVYLGAVLATDGHPK